MPHPQMFDDGDPLFLRVKIVALSLPGAQMKVSHGRPAFFTGKVFAYYGGSVRIDGVWDQHPASLIFLPSAAEDEPLLQDPRVFVPAYLGPAGWLGIDVDASADWREITELITESYRATASRRLVRELDDVTRPTDEPPCHP